MVQDESTANDVVVGFVIVGSVWRKEAWMEAKWVKLHEDDEALLLVLGLSLLVSDDDAWRCWYKGSTDAKSNAHSSFAMVNLMDGTHSHTDRTLDQD